MNPQPNEDDELPLAEPWLKPLSPRIRESLLSDARDYENDRIRARRRRAGLSLAILLMAALAYLFMRSQRLQPPVALPPSQQLAAPPNAKPTPIVAPAPPAVTPPSPRQSTDQSSAQYVKSPVRADPFAPHKKALVYLPDGTTRMQDIPDN